MSPGVDKLGRLLLRHSLYMEEKASPFPSASFERRNERHSTRVHFQNRKSRKKKQNKKPVALFLFLCVLLKKSKRKERISCTVFACMTERTALDDEWNTRIVPGGLNVACGPTGRFCPLNGESFSLTTDSNFLPLTLRGLFLFRLSLFFFDIYNNTN